MRIVLATICCRFGGWGLVKKLNFCLDLEHKVWSRYWSWSSGRICSWSLASFFLLMFCRGWILVEILRLGLVKILRLKCCGEADAWSRFWRWNLIKICVQLVIWTQPLGPLCLWQCFQNWNYQILHACCCENLLRTKNGPLAFNFSGAMSWWAEKMVPSRFVTSLMGLTTFCWEHD